MNDVRASQLQKWLENKMGFVADSFTVVSGDASFRRYFRLREEGNSQSNRATLIAVDAPPPQEDCRPFVAVAEGLLASGVNVPRVIAVDYDLGFMVLSDLGDDLLLDGLDSVNVDTRYQQALNCLPRVMSCEAVVPQYEQAKLRDEMSLFSDWFLKQYLGVALDGDLLNQVFDCLIGSAVEQPQVFVHRDYHSRNLMLTLKGELGVIDFQDAVRGPITYDIVSLLRDCYVAWPLARVESWVDDSRQQLQKQGLLDCAVEQQQFMRWFDLMGARRHLKAIGIFARLNCRDSKPGYLLDIPRTLRYLLDVCDRYEALFEFAGVIRQSVLPVLSEKNSQSAKWFQATPYFDLETEVVVS